MQKAMFGVMLHILHLAGLVCFSVHAPRAGMTAELTGASEKGRTNSLGMKLVLIPAGEFTLGSGKDFNDKPQRSVAIAKPFFLSACEVTQRQFREIMGSNPSWLAYHGDSLPVECVSWFDAVEFCRRLGEKEGKHYRLPTEAEWEYACKAGNNWMTAAGPQEPTGVCDYAWTPDNTGTETHPVGAKKPNPWGLYDMLGNVYEWCSDWYDDIAYRTVAPVAPQGPAECSNTLDQGGRVARGGSSLGGGMNCLRTNRCSSTARNSWTPYARHRGLGFRVVCECE